MILHEFNLEVTPGSIPPVLHMAQYESGRSFVAHLKNNGEAFNPGGTLTAKIKGRNAAGVCWELSADYNSSDKSVGFVPEGACVDQSGIMPVQMELTDAYEQNISTLLMLWDIQPAGYTNEQAAVSPEFQTALEEAVAAAIAGQGLGFTEEFKQALLNAFANVAWDDTDGQDYYDALEAALYPEPSPTGLTSITASYDQDRPIYDCDSLDIVKLDLSVVANYSNGTSETLSDSDYELSGTLTGGTSTITVSYGGKTDTIEVTVKDVPTGYTKCDYIQRYADIGTVSVTQAGLLYLKKYTNLNLLSCEFAYCGLSGHTAGNSIFGGRDGNGNTKSYAFYAGAGDLGYHLHGNDSNPKPSATDGVVHTVKYTNTSASPSSLQVDDGVPVSVAWSNNNTINRAVAPLGNPYDDSSNVNIHPLIQCGFIRFYDLTGTLVGYYKVVLRTADNVIGMYDLVEDTFYTCSTATNATVGNANCKYKVGNWS